MLFDLGGHARGHDLGLELGKLAFRVVRFAEFLLQLTQLFTKHRLALSFPERGLRLLSDAFGDPEHLDPFGEKLDHLVEPLLQIDRLDDVLLLGRFHIHEAGHEISKLRGGLNTGDHVRQLGRGLWQERKALESALPQNRETRLDLGTGDR